MFRVDGVPPSGAVVPPADKSQHLIGYAVDLNKFSGGILLTRHPCLRTGEADNADKFIAAINTYCCIAA
jgi:hypothetical protein